MRWPQVDFEKILRNARRGAKWVAIAIIVAAAMLFAFRILDLLVAWRVYSWFFQPLAQSGIPETLSGAIAIWLMAAVILVLPSLAYAFVFNRSKAILIVTAGVSAWFVIAYFISLPRDGQLFNPITGKAMYRYSQATDGKIKLLPLGYRYDPATGEELKDLTSEIAKKYAEQSAQPAQSRPAQPTQSTPAQLAPIQPTPPVEAITGEIPLCDGDHPTPDNTIPEPTYPTFAGNSVRFNLNPNCWGDWFDIRRSKFAPTKDTKVQLVVPKGGWVELMTPDGKVTMVNSVIDLRQQFSRFRIRGSAGGGYTGSVTIRRVPVPDQQ